MQRAPIDGIELEYEIRGTGEPVVLIHAGVCADFFRPLIDSALSPAGTPCSATTAAATRAATACRVRSASPSRRSTAAR